ncbi:hypothetical protein [Massilia sp. Se16.2.3]|uniref:hypothetical protein n=1 Tax=Massilia sp. Se16.2.3 TaxID=2709303 RepID=UPI001E64B1D0|nr:hypothetical protein [Massilia sp. Se16.2.3]
MEALPLALACGAASLAATLVLAAHATPRAWWRRPNARALLVLVGGTAAIGSALWWLAPHRSDPPAAPATARSKRPGRDAATASPRR